MFERLPDVALPDGVTPSVSPLFSPSGLIYRYVLESPDRSPMELKTIEDWVIERQYKSVPGVADDSGLGGPTMQYQVLLDPARIAGAGLSVPAVIAARSAEQRQRGRRLLLAGRAVLLRARARPRHHPGGHRQRRARRPQRRAGAGQGRRPGRDRAGAATGAVRLHGSPQESDEAVEGVVVMRTGEQAQVVLDRIEKKTRELNQSILPPDVKIHPFYDRRELIALTTRTVEDNLLRGMLLVVVILVFFLYDLRSGLIVAATIPLALLFAFICLDLKHVPANLLSIGAIDFGILVDGAVVMVENIFRQLALREGKPFKIHEVILEAAGEVDRPIVYAVAVIMAGFLPIYALSGAAGDLFKPMADTTLFALAGSLLLTLTLLPILCAVFLRKGVRERRNVIFEAIKSAYTRGLDVCLRHPWATTIVSALLLAGSLLLVPGIGAEFMPHLDEGALWVRATMPSTISFEEAAKISPQIRAILRSLPPGHHGRQRARPPGRRHRSDRLLQQRVLRRPEAVQRVDGPLPHQAGADRGDQQEARGLPGHRLQLHPAGGGRGRRGRRPASRARWRSSSSAPTSTCWSARGGRSSRRSGLSPGSPRSRWSSSSASRAW